MKLLKKVRPGASEKEPTDQTNVVVSVLVEPLPGHSDEEVVHSLECSGASEVAILAPGFISAQVRRVALEAVEEVAYVHPKHEKQMR